MHDADSIALLAATRQLRTLKLAGIYAVAGIALASGAPFAAASGAGIIAAALFVVGAILLLVPPWVALRTIKCPNCGAHWLQCAMGEQPISSWLSWLLTFKACPKCQFSSTSPASVPPPNESQERMRER